MPVALPLLEIGTLLLVLWCIAAALLMVSIIKAVADGFSVLPFPLNKIGGIVSWAAQAIINVLGKAEGGVDAAIGASWHALAHYMNDFWNLLKESATGYVLAAEMLERIWYAHSRLRTSVHHNDHALHGIEHGVRDLERQWRGIEHKVKQLERDLTKGIGHDLRIGLRDLAKEVKGIDQLVTTTIPRALDYAEGQIAGVKDFIKATPGTSYLDWVGGIVAAGLAAIGMDWLICRSRRGVNGKSGCNLWDDIESLLGLAIVAGLALDLPALIGEAQQATPGIIGGIEKLAGLKS